MSYKIKCPECNELIYSNANKCDCGWKNKNSTYQSEQKDNRCSFNDFGEKCKMPGSMNKGGDVWYCSYHLNSDNTAGSKWTSFINKNFNEIIHYRKHYQTNFKDCVRCDTFKKLENEFEKEMGA